MAESAIGNEMRRRGIRPRVGCAVSEISIGRFLIAQRSFIS
jgi:hypothetical protein